MLKNQIPLFVRCIALTSSEEASCTRRDQYFNRRRMRVSQRKRSLVSMKGSVQPLLSRLQLIDCIIDLKNVGVKFKKRKTDRFRDIKFNNGCHMDSMDHMITSYVVFMDNLIYSAGDISHLHSCGIIENCLGNDAEVVDLFNGLYREVVFNINGNHLSQVHNEVNTYFKHRQNAWI
ncbi:hypothetical protein Dimus_017139 [Dionaea muscipula]